MKVWFRCFLQMDVFQVAVNKNSGLIEISAPLKSSKLAPLSALTNRQGVTSVYLYQRCVYITHHLSMVDGYIYRSMNGCLFLWFLCRELYNRPMDCLCMCSYNDCIMIKSYVCSIYVYDLPKSINTCNPPNNSP